MAQVVGGYESDQDGGDYADYVPRTEIKPSEFFLGITNQILQLLHKIFIENQIETKFIIRNTTSQKGYFRFAVNEKRFFDAGKPDNWHLYININNSRVLVTFDMGNELEHRLEFEKEVGFGDLNNEVTLLGNKMLVMDTLRGLELSCKKVSRFNENDNDIIIHAFREDSSMLGMFSKSYYALFRIQFYSDEKFISVSACVYFTKYPELNEIKDKELKSIGSIKDFEKFIKEELGKKPLESRWSELERRMDGLLFIST